LARINKPKPAAKVIYAQQIMTAPGLRKVMFDIFVSRRPLILGAIINRLSASQIDCPRVTDGTSRARAHNRMD